MAENKRPRPVFIYGTLCAKPFLAWVLTGDATQTEEISALIRPARVQHVARYAIHGCDYPAAVKEHGSSISGYLLQPRTTSERKKLDDFEGEVYRVEAFQSVVSSNDGTTAEEVVEADIYLWNGDKSSVSDRPWDLEVFVKGALDDWIDLFEGIEMVGEEDN